MDTSFLNEFVRDKRVVIVGPAASMEGSGLGFFIDNYDVVVRVNWQWPIPDDLKPDVGERIDILYNGNQGGDIKKLVSTPGAEKIKVLYLAVEGNRPNPKAVRDICLAKGIRLVYIPLSFIFHYDREMNTRPNTGTLAICHLLSAPLAVLHVTGFTFGFTGYHRHYPISDMAKTVQHLWAQKIPVQKTVIHDHVKQINYFRQLMANDKRITVDDKLKLILAGEI